MTREFSAGGIVYKIVKTNNLPASPAGGQPTSYNVVWLLAQHSQHKGWVFPKGLIGDNIKGENKTNTAIREVKEETGIEAQIVEELVHPATYWYEWEGEKRFKTTYYYLMKFIGGDINLHDHEMSAVEWLPTDKVDERLTYDSDKIAFKEALKLISQLST